MIYCPSCSTANRDGSRFCNECGAKLPTLTSTLCSTCGTPNPPNSLFCEKCGARLIASLAEEPEEPEAPTPAALVLKGLSLPTKSPAEVEPAEPAKSAEEEAPEWMQVVQSGVAGTSALDVDTAGGETPLSPPSAPQAQPAAEEMPDWLRDLRPGAGAEEALPDWLDELGVEEQPASEQMALSTGDSALDWLSQLGATAPEQPSDQGAAAAAETPAWLSGADEETRLQESAVAPDWMSSRRAAAPQVDTQPTEEMPDWLREAQVEQPHLETAAADETPDWMNSLRAASIEPEATAEEEKLPPESAAPQQPAADWLTALRQATPGIEAEQPGEEAEPEWLREESGVAPEAIGGPQAYDQEVPDWLREPSAASESAEVQPPAQPEEEGVPDWLKGLGVAAAGAAAAGAFAEEQKPEGTPPQEPAADWLMALRQATPEIEAEQPGEEAEPEWMREESGIAPEAIGGPQAYDQEVPDWLREAGAAESQPAAQAAEETPEWLREPSAASESAEAQPPAQPEEEGLPDWLKGLGVAAAGAAAAGAFAEDQKPEGAPPQQPAADWLTALRQATPEIEAEQPGEEAEPEWLREEIGVAPEAIGGPQAYDQEVPDWLREPSAASESAEAQPPAQPEEEGVPDWLKGLGVAAAGAAAISAFAEEQKPEGTPPQEPAADWLTALRQATPEIEAEQPGEEAEPEWLREESGAAPQAIGGVQSYDQEVPDWLRETQPAPALASETPPTEAVTSGETPDWLRGLTSTAAVAGVAMAAAEPTAEEPPETAQPKETAEAAPETESWVSKAAPVAVAGLAAAAVAGAAKKPEKAEAGPVEMPEWLKEINQEQQAAKTAIPVPPPEPAGLTQAEIPAWLVALRPKEEAAVPQEAETPTETEGPLAGIANALPPAPMMGEMHGLPAKLQFAVSAEDQARAGVLKELLTQHAAAPASVEQFVVKGSAIGRRALRWIVAFLIIVALLVPIGNDINKLTRLPLLPSATSMIVPPAVSSAAFEVSLMAQLPPNSKVLVMFDYDATQAGELNRVAQAFLQSPALRNAQIEVASLNAQGSALAQAVLQNVPGLKYVDLSFVPGQVNGVQSLLAEAGDVKLIIELAASPDTVRWWAEQLKANRAEIPLVAGVSAGAEPLAMPYVQSGQVKGLVSGFPGAVAYLNATGMMNTYSQDQIKNYQVPLDALTLANYVMVVLIVVGLIAALLRGAGRRSA